MIVSDQQREENFQEYLRLLNNPDYVDVTFDEQSGGVSAIHLDHKFDKQMGPFGRRRGDYENNPQIQAIKSIKSCLVIAGDQIVDYLKKATTPSAEWF